MRHARLRLDEPPQLAIGQVDRVGEDRSRAEAAGTVVDVDVVLRLGEEARDLGDLARVLRDMGLPPRAGPRRERGRLPEHLLGARDREPRRDRVPEPAVVRPVPLLDQLGGFADRSLQDRRRVDRLVVGDPIHHHLAQDRPDAMLLGGPEGALHRGLVDRAVGQQGRRPGGRERPERRGGEAGGVRLLVEPALQREDVAVEPGQEIEAGPEARVRQLRQVGVEVDHAGQEHERPEVDRLVACRCRRSFERRRSGARRAAGRRSPRPTRPRRWSRPRRRSRCRRGSPPCRRRRAASGPGRAARTAVDPGGASRRRLAPGSRRLAASSARRRAPRRDTRSAVAARFASPRLPSRRHAFRRAPRVPPVRVARIRRVRDGLHMQATRMTRSLGPAPVERSVPQPCEDDADDHRRPRLRAPHHRRDRRRWDRANRDSTRPWASPGAGAARARRSSSFGTRPRSRTRSGARRGSSTRRARSSRRASSTSTATPAWCSSPTRGTRPRSRRA